MYVMNSTYSLDNSNKIPLDCKVESEVGAASVLSLPVVQK